MASIADYLELDRSSVSRRPSDRDARLGYHPLNPAARHGVFGPIFDSRMDGYSGLNASDCGAFAATGDL